MHQKSERHRDKDKPRTGFGTTRKDTPGRLNIIKSATTWGENGKSKGNVLTIECGRGGPVYSTKRAEALGFLHAAKGETGKTI